MYDSGGVNGCNTVGNGALHYVLQLMGRVWCYGERLRARYHNHLATLYPVDPAWNFSQQCRQTADLALPAPAAQLHVPRHPG